MCKKDDAIKKVVGILRDRGIEATPCEVETWAQKIVETKKRNGKTCDVSQICCGVINNMPSMTLLLHLHFGDNRTVDTESTGRRTSGRRVFFR